MIYHKPFNLSLDEFLKGEEYKDSQISLIEEYEGSFLSLMRNRAENCRYVNVGPIMYDMYTPSTFNFKPIDSQIITLPSGYIGIHYRKTPSGVIVRDSQKRIIGFYVDSVVAISEQYLGCGLGTETIIVSSLLHSVNPALELGPASYTPKGLEAHKSAWKSYRRFPERYILQIKEPSG